MQKRDASITKVNLTWITQMKGLGMLCIVLFHWFDYFSEGIVRHAANMGAQGNHIFFTLSAFGLTLSLLRGRAEKYSMTDWGEWLKKRFIKMLIPYYVSVAIIFLSITAWGYLAQDYVFTFKRMMLNWGTVLSTLFLYRNFIGSHTTAINTPWWFAITILQFYLIFPFLYLLNRRISWKWLASGALILNGAYIFLYSVILHSDNNAFRCFPLQFIFSFTMGLIFCRLYVKDEKRFFALFGSWQAILVGILLESAGVCLSFQGLVGKAFNDLFFGVGIFLITFNAIRLIQRFAALSKFLTLVGEYSLPLFLLHAPYIFLFFYPKPQQGFVFASFCFMYYGCVMALIVGLTNELLFKRLLLRFR